MMVYKEFKNKNDLCIYLNNNEFEPTGNTIPHSGIEYRDGKLFDKANKEDYRYVFVCIAPRVREIYQVSPDIPQIHWYKKKKTYTNGVYTCNIMMSYNIRTTNYCVHSDIIREPDPLLAFHDQVRSCMCIGKSNIHFCIGDAEKRFSELENVAHRFLRIYTI